MQNNWEVKDVEIQDPEVTSGIVIDRFNKVSGKWISVVRSNGKVACRTHGVRETAIKNAYKAVS